MWLQETRGRKESLLGTMKTCMLKSVRTATGLGSPPNIWKNNKAESLNSVMKEELRNESLDIDRFLERVKDRVFDQQVEEIIRAIYGMGEYQLSDKYQHLALTPMQLNEVSEIQRKAFTKTVFQAKLVVREKVDCHLSVQYDAIKETVKVPFYTLKQIWGILQNSF